MPMHDWTRVIPGTYHAFHYQWVAALANALNGGGLPRDYFALPEQRVPGPEPDVLTLARKGGRKRDKRAAGGTSVRTAIPKARFVAETDLTYFARRANRLVVRHQEGDVVAVIEIVSPGNKSSRSHLSLFLRKIFELMEQGVHLLIVDPFPPGRRDPQGIHKAIWDEFTESSFALPADKQLTLASYDCGSGITAYVEPIAVGDRLPAMPLFLAYREHVPCPLEAAYQAAWKVFPDAVKEHLED
jgi:Protein of unknown function (DUF4058)